jgi:uncharacterized protein YbbC (DUF1343 family)
MKIFNYILLLVFTSNLFGLDFQSNIGNTPIVCSDLKANRSIHDEGYDDSTKTVKPGSYSFEKYYPLLKDKKVAIVANQSSEVNSTSLVDILLKDKVELIKIFTPEHGYKGSADAGEKIDNSKDDSGIEIISLYGKNRKPSARSLKDVEIVLFDLQDVGVRFYTYISTLHYVMEACAENDVKLIVLDRPNPNIHYVDGPVLKKEHKSFVGMHEVPVVYGMTIGEYALMINGESWLKNGIKCDLKIIEIENYTRTTRYDLPVKPSPNLPNAKSINLYPSLCFFEGTPISAGRGTNMQFQIYGAPIFKDLYPFEFTPDSNIGSKNPKFKGETCYGIDLSSEEFLSKIQLNYLIDAYEKFPNKEEFFNNFFDKLAGDSNLKDQIIKGLSQNEIKKTWKEDIDNFKQVRKKYLIYF